MPVRLINPLTVIVGNSGTVFCILFQDNNQLCRDIDKLFMALIFFKLLGMELAFICSLFLPIERIAMVLSRQ